MWKPVYSDPFMHVRKDGRMQGVTKYKDKNGVWKQKTCLIPRHLTSQRSVKRYLRAWWVELHQCDMLDNDSAARFSAKSQLEPSSPRMYTVEEMIQCVLDDKLAAGVIELSTYSKERATLQRVKKHPIGSMNIDEVAEEDCISFFRFLRSERHLAINTVRVSQLQLKSAYWTFIQEHKTKNNPMRHIKLYPKQKSLANAVTKAEYPQFHSAVKELKPGARYHVVVWLAFYTGMREAEIAALRWANVDLENGLLNITHSIGKDDTRHSQGKDTYIKLTKSKKRRAIPINDRLVEVLLARWEYQKRERGGREPISTTYVAGFPDDRYIRPQSISAWWIRFSRTHGLTGNQGRRIKFHDIRHSFATNMLSGGADVNSVASILGHANPSTTLDIYASPDMQAITHAMRTVGMFSDFAVDADVKMSHMYSMGRFGKCSQV